MGLMQWFRRPKDGQPKRTPGRAQHEPHVATVPPDDTDQTAGEVEQARTEARGEERLLETKGRDDQELRDSRIPPRQS